MKIEITERERLIILFELNSALETINESLANGDQTFVGEDEDIMTLISKLEA